MSRVKPAVIPPDAPSRDIVRHALTKTLLVEAGAGSGKTTMLVERMMALLDEGGVPAENLAAVTFTRKAASHLRRRFQVSLEGAIEKEPPGTRRDRLATIRASIDRITLGTIDAFCALLLAERPLEAGIDPGALKVELQEAALFRQRAFRDFVGELAGAGEPVEELFALGVTMRELEDSFALYAEYPDVEPVTGDSSAMPDFEDIRRGVEDFLRRAIPLVPEAPGAAGRDDLQTRLLEAKDLLELPDFGTPPGFVRLLRTLRPSGGVTQYKWPDKAEAKRLGQEFEDLRQEIIKPALAAWRVALHARIYEVLRPALGAVRGRAAGGGPFDYTDLLVATRDLLRDSPAVRRAFAARFTHLLVDEFQDTDPLQAEILLYLTGTDSEERDVSLLRPRPGSLFVVGDPKQSIFRFRRADISSYLAFRDTISKSGGEIVPLTANFRAAPALTRAASDVFRKLFPATADDKQAAFAALQPVRPDGGAASGAFRLPSAPDRNPDDVARFVSWAVASGWPVAEEGGPRPARYSDFLVLTRTRDVLDSYARALEAYGVPVDVSGSRSLPISRGLRELRPFLAAIQDPDDGVSVVAFLAGPLCGVDDDALFAYRRAGGRFNYLVDPPEGTDPRILQGLRLLATSRGDVRALGAGAALGLIVERLGAVARLAAGSEGHTASGNLLKVLALARRFSGEGQSFRDIVERLGEDEPALDLEEMSIEPITGGALRLMNLHRAKGLEAPIVVLAELGVPSKPHPRRHVSRDGTSTRGWFTAGVSLPRLGRPPQWGVVATPPDWDEREKEEVEFEVAERTRHLYVAATRAQDTLVVSVREDKPEQGAWAQLRGVLKELPRAAIEYAPGPPAEAPDLASALPGARRAIASARLEAATPAFAAQTVTALAHAAGPRAPSAAEDARGPAWGRVLHGVLEAAMRDEVSDLKLLAQNFLREEELPPEFLPDVLCVAESVTSSDLWARANRSSRRFVEVPFEILVPREELGLSDGPAEVLLKGALDLVFEEKDEWLIVDWKSDVVGANLVALIAHYAPQVKIYRKYWEKLTKQRAKAGLFFLDNGHLEWIEEGAPPGISLKVNTDRKSATWRQEKLFDE